METLLGPLLLEPSSLVPGDHPGCFLEVGKNPQKPNSFAPENWRERPMFRGVILVFWGGQNQKTNPKSRGTIPRDLLTTVADKVTKWDDPPYKILSPPKKKQESASFCCKD